MKFGDYLRQLRVQQGWTQPEAAARVGIEQSYLSKLEAGKSVPSSEIYDKLMGTYAFAADDLVDVLLPAELERLRDIESVRTLILTRSHRRRAVPRRWMLTGLAALTLGGGFCGLAMIDPGRDVTTYTYVSEDAPSSRASLESEAGIAPDAQTRFITQMRGPEFSETTEEGTRTWRLVGSGKQWEPARHAWALIPGTALILAGFGCFFLAWRWR